MKVGTGVDVKEGEMVGVAVAGCGPITGAVGEGNGGEVGDGSSGAGEAVAAGRGSDVQVGRGQVGRGVGVGVGDPGMATMIRLITIMPASNPLMIQKRVWLVLLRRFRVCLLTTIDLLMTCLAIIPKLVVVVQSCSACGASEGCLAASSAGCCFLQAERKAPSADLGVLAAAG